MSKNNKDRLYALAVAGRNKTKPLTDPMAKMLAEKAANIEALMNGLKQRKAQAVKNIQAMDAELAKLEAEELETASLMSHVADGAFDGDPATPKAAEPEPVPEEPEPEPA